MNKAAVVGGGISGIAAAFYLQKYGVDVDLYETGNRLGGRIGSDCIDGRYLDFGGKNIGRKYNRFREFVSELGGMEFEYFGFNTSQVINGNVVKLSKEKKRFFNILRVVSLAGIGGIKRLLPLMKAVDKDASQGFLNTTYFNRIADRFDEATLASFFPKRCTDHLIRPVTVRMNGAEPQECYPGNFGSNLALVLDSYEQIKQGMHTLLDRFQAKSKSVNLLTEHHVITIEPHNGGTTIYYSHENKTSRAEYNTVIVALPAVQAIALVSDLLPELAALLGNIRYYPVAVAIVCYRDAVFPDTQRAMVFDSSSPLSNAGAYGIHDLDIVRYTFSGKAARSLVTKESSSEEVVFLGEKIIEPYFSIRQNIRQDFIYKYISPGLCAYSPYHYQTLEKIDDCNRFFKGLFFTGDYRCGASIEACFRASAETVDIAMKGRSE